MNNHEKPRKNEHFDKSTPSKSVLKKKLFIFFILSTDFEHLEHSALIKIINLFLSNFLDAHRRNAPKVDV